MSKRLMAISGFVPLAVIVSSCNSLRGSGAGGLVRFAFCCNWFGWCCTGGGEAEGVVSLTHLLGVDIIWFSTLFRFCLCVTSSFCGSPGLPLPIPWPQARLFSSTSAGDLAVSCCAGMAPNMWWCPLLPLVWLLIGWVGTWAW